MLATGNETHAITGYTRALIGVRWRRCLTIDPLSWMLVLSNLSVQQNVDDMFIINCVHDILKVLSDEKYSSF